MVLNIMLNYFLIPQLKATGSAYASLITQFSVFFFQLAISVYIFKFKINLRYVLSLIIYIIIGISIAYVSVFINWGWVYKIGIISLLLIIIAFVIKLLDIKALYRLLISFRQNKAD